MPTNDTAAREREPSPDPERDALARAAHAMIDSFATAAEIRHFLAGVLGLPTAPRLVGANVIATPAVPTLVVALDRYMREHVTPATMKPRTIEWRTLACRRLREILGPVPLDGRDFVAEAVAVAQAGLPPSGARECCHTLARVLNLAQRWWRTEPHAIPRKLTASQAPNRTRALSIAEAHRFQIEGLDVLDARGHDRRDRRLPGATGAVRFILATGLRVSEVCALEWKHVDPERQWVYVKEGVKGEPRHVVIGRIAGEILGRQSTRGRWVFAGRRLGAHVTRRTVLQTVHDAAALAELDIHRVHDLRHTWATTALKLGIQDRYVMNALGWKSEAMMRTYSHVHAIDLREACDKVAAAIAGKPDRS